MATAAAVSYQQPFRNSKCKDHPYEIGPGICASCLRLRLLSLLSSPSPPPCPPLHHQYHPPLFYSTPQITSTTTNKDKKRNHHLQLLPSLFRSREKKLATSQIHLDPPNHDEPPPPRHQPSWISSLLGRRPRKPPPTFSDYENFHSCPSLGYTPSPAWRVAAPTPARRSSRAASWLSPLWTRPHDRAAENSGESTSQRRRRRRHGLDDGVSASSKGASLVAPCRSRKLADMGRLS